MRLGILLPVLLLITRAASSRCPYKCYCTGNAVYCQKLTRFPDFSVLPSWIAEVSIYKMHIPSIPASAFSNLPNVKQISIYDGTIDEIQSCAFQGLRNVQRLEIYNVKIRAIQMYAFSNIRNLETLSIYKSTIGNIASYAFYKINGVATFFMHTLNIRQISTNAFFEIGRIDYFYMYGNNVTSIRRGAFSRSSITSMNMFRNYFANLECQTIDALHDRIARNFSFYSNDLNCGCHMAWLLQTKKKELLNGDKGPINCVSPRHSGQIRPVAQLTSSMMDCRGKNYLANRPGCPAGRVTPPIRTIAKQCLRRI